MSVSVNTVDCQVNVNDSLNHCLPLQPTAASEIYLFTSLFVVQISGFGVSELSNMHTKFSFHLIATHQRPNFGSQSMF